MSESHGTSTIEIQQVRHPKGQGTALRFQLKADGSVRDITIRRSLDPTLFDFIAAHAVITEQPS